MSNSEGLDEFTAREADAELADPERALRPADFPLIPLVPTFFMVSGRYEWKQSFPLIPKPLPTPIPIPTPPFAGSAEEDAGLGHGNGNDNGTGSESAFTPILPWWFQREELRLDVDGRYPQMTASGTLFNGKQLRVHWIASLVVVAKNTWKGTIWYKDGDAAVLPHTQVIVKAVQSWFPAQRKATVTFSGGGAAARTLTYDFASSYFHDVQLEFDCAAGTTAVTSVHTHGHPNKPASLPGETLHIETVFRRAGFNVTKSGGDSIVPMAGAGADARWSDSEMHDAMQLHWSRFADVPQWSMWAFFASLHEIGTSLGGIMFDDIGPNHRQGTAIFNDSFIKNAPAGDPAPAAWVRRMRFWTAVHEMGHGFNLAHSWQKSHPPSWGTPWIPLVNEPEARSFMNYPYNVSGGQAAFFANFGYGFSDGELLFMRHAPFRFVQMGNASWFDQHGFQEREAPGDPALRLEARVNRDRAAFEFLEPVVIELKLTNISGRVQVVDEELLSGDHDMTVILKKERQPAREWAPYARYCREPRPVALPPGESIYASLFVSAGLNGWDIADPGRYRVQVAIEHAERLIVTQPLELRILPPRAYEEELLAQDLFSEEVGRTLAFDGTRYFEQANDTLQEVADRLPERRVASHARVALGAPALLAYKQIDFDAKRPTIRTVKAKPREAATQLKDTLFRSASEAAETLGHIDYKHYVDRYSSFLAEQGEPAAAAECQSVMHSALSMRKVLPRVLRDIEDAQGRYQATRKGTAEAQTAAADL